MTRAMLSACLVALFSAAALADKLILTDGRTFTGTVTVEADTVLIKVPYGTLRFPKNQVERIELKDTPEQEFRKKLGETSLEDPEALFALAQWADKNTLGRQASDLYALILKLDPDHAATRRVLGYVHIGRQWLTFAKALEQAQGKLEAGSYAALLDDVLPALKAAAGSRKMHLQVMDLEAHTLLRSRQFAEAARAFAELARKSEGPAVIRNEAIAGILTKSPDGMHVLREASPPTAVLFHNGSPSIQPGPASLANPAVLTEALRDLAKKDIAAGRKHMAEAARLERTDPDAAAAKYAQAERIFDHADALVARISLSHRLEISRRKIAAIRKDVDADARKFDEAMTKLGVRDMSPQAYRQMILRLLHHLDNTRDDLKRILAIAKPYPEQLVLEIKWAELDLTRVQGMRKILQAELDGRK